MLRTVRHLWPYGACFVFNLYYNWQSLVFWKRNGTSRFMYSRQDATQGDPLAVITYDIGILLLIKKGSYLISLSPSMQTMLDH